MSVLTAFAISVPNNQHGNARGPELAVAVDMQRQACLNSRRSRRWKPLKSVLFSPSEKLYSRASMSEST